MIDQISIPLRQKRLAPGVSEMRPNVRQVSPSRNTNQIILVGSHLRAKHVTGVAWITDPALTSHCYAQREVEVLILGVY